MVPKSSYAWKMVCLVSMLGMVVSGCGGSGGGTTPPAGMTPMAGAFASPPNDTYYANMWHLNNTGQVGPAGGQATAGEDIRAQNAWTMGATGTGIRICVVDDGVAIANPDLAGNAVAGAHGVPDGAMMGVMVGDPTPGTPNDNHGTNVSGVACAVGHNNIGVCGVAPRAGLVGVRDGGGIVAVQTAGMTWGLATNHIYNQSFGPTEDGTFTLTDAAELAAINTAMTGRGGRGALFIRAAGNGGAAGHHCNLDGFNNEFGVIVISGVDAQGRRPAYAQEGACITACSPSSDETSMPDNLPDMYTTDVVGGPENLPADPNYMRAFGQTSGAAPLASGVCALLLQQNPNLTWRDVRRILAFSARQNHAADAGWTNNGAGRPVHPAYGYGVIDAGAAVGMAVGFTSLGNAVIAPIAGNPGEAGIDVAIPDNDAVTGFTRATNVLSLQTCDQVNVRLTLTHANLRHLRIVLTSPSGTQSELLAPAAMIPGVPPLANDEIKLCTVRCMGETANGLWTLKVTDEEAGTTGTLHSWALDIYAD